MDFNHSDDRRILADTFGRFLANRYPFDRRQAIAGSSSGWSKELWDDFAELGVISVLFEEDIGGLGGQGFDIAVVFEQIGKALVVEPLLGSLMAGHILGQSGKCAALLAECIAGSVRLAFAHQEPDSHYDLAAVATTARQDAGVWLLTGSKSVVPQLSSADHIIVSARISGDFAEEVGIGLFLLSANARGVALTDYPLIDGGHGADLTLTRTEATLIAEDGHGLIEKAVAAGNIALCWEAIGVMDVLKASTLEHLRTRKQFGAPIGKFQALQHRMATVAVEIEQARSAAINAANAFGAPRRERERAVSAAKFTIGRVGTLVAEEAIQMHGGIGVTWEIPLSHYAKRLTMIGHQLGDEDHHLSRFIDLDSAA